ncbi:hypothetical protein BO94DRAFT_180939 [Aspergillus sclerotioniger CBS 115572]|uniref:Uncharacterized protein n=1 Tax=Aspergillus sclerotioniger CBS 115572 TaxID=1450535 RepID=A0A317W036_9EURO|nr:hypothetical protein BO94DRAFT_180939 [Aspergillus sclerotioniger CBS 115572]PWY78538.1 hypothetical protein BO94DRAFT_180939 [Aspergillus sclerotioniger CBS 115572]
MRISSGRWVPGQPELVRTPSTWLWPGKRGMARLALTRTGQEIDDAAERSPSRPQVGASLFASLETDRERSAESPSPQTLQSPVASSHHSHHPRARGSISSCRVSSATAYGESSHLEPMGRPSTSVCYLRLEAALLSAISRRSIVIMFSVFSGCTTRNTGNEGSRWDQRHINWPCRFPWKEAQRKIKHIENPPAALFLALSKVMLWARRHRTCQRSTSSHSVSNEPRTLAISLYGTDGVLVLLLLGFRDGTSLQHQFGLPVHVKSDGMGRKRFGSVSSTNTRHTVTVVTVREGSKMRISW